jgi:hypothetical protein
MARPVNIFVARDEGHGFARSINNLAMAAATEKFLAKHLVDVTRKTFRRMSPAS